MQWKKYKYLYRTFEVSEKGQIRNENGVIMKGSVHKGGFRILNLRYKGERGEILNKGLLVHRIVALCWIENSMEKPYVIHKDGDLLNNKVANLEWATSTDKINHQKKMGRHGNQKLTTKEVVQIKRALKKGEKAISSIAKDYHISHTQIHRIKRGENW